MTEQPYKSAVKTEQLCQAWWRWKVRFMHMCLRSTPTYTWRTAKPSDQTHTKYTTITWENSAVF